MPGQAGDLSACVLRLTDAAGLLQVDLGVAATKAANSGLWVGEARVTQVVQYLKKYERDPVGNPVVRLTEDEGAYSVMVTNEVVGGVSRPFPMRLILHNDGTNTVLLQRVFLGMNPQTNAIVTTQQRFLDPAQLASARRISAAHLPWSSQNTPWPITITSNVEASTLIKRFDQLAMPLPGAQMRNKRPFAYVVPQDDVTWLNYVNTWVTLKRIEGYFDGLERKWLPSA
jgi:hypothetical protein